MDRPSSLSEKRLDFSCPKPGMQRPTNFVKKWFDPCELGDDVFETRRKNPAICGGEREQPPNQPGQKT